MVNRHIIWCALLLMVAFLSGCSSMSTKDGPPNFYVDETKIPNAVPKVEPLSKYGNMPSYRIGMTRYYVLRSSRNFEEQGVASWYGTKFDRHRTSSGERYNMLAMTAAHRTLPLPTYVQVTNMRNGRQVIVKVNDRGPFASNRIIDLSYVAAKKLGMLGHGTTMVDIKAINPREINIHQNWIATNNALSYHPENYPQHDMFANNHVRSTRHHYPKHPVANTFVYLQVGAFQNRTYVENLKNRLLTLTSSPVKIHGSRKAYRIQIGPIRDVATAGRISKRLRAAGINKVKIG